MLAPIAHRGPDGEGVFLSGNCGLGHRRLAIVDVDGGPQPMPNEDRTVWIVFNGEIYNHNELRDRLIACGHQFRSRSDTEAILHAYEEYGEDCVNYLQGMFAFAIWDARNHELFAARDRVGIKPFYYAQTRTGLLFASELKAILVDPSVTREICGDALNQFFSFLYVPGEETLFKSIRKLPPGHTLTVRGDTVKIRQYWTLEYTRERWSRPFGHVTEELRALLNRTVKSHLMADVPLGVLLSGGLDSSAIATLAAEHSGGQLKTFTVGFDDPGVADERPFARQVAERLSSEHHELSISAEDFWNFLPEYVWHMEEPVCEPPAVALYYVTKLARERVKVLLSGEGGDEAFGGYPNYTHMLKVDAVGKAIAPFSKPAGTMAALAGVLLGRENLRRYGGAMGRPLAEHYFSRSSYPAAYFNRRTALFNNHLRDTAEVDASRRMAEIFRGLNHLSLLDQMLYADTTTWLPNDLLVKADKMTMATSVELRVPLLDHKVLEFAATLAPAHKVLGNETKRILKEAVKSVLPPDIINRKKAGFPVPYEGWLRGPLAERIRETLLSDKSMSRGYLNRKELELLLDGHAKTGKQSKEVFSLLVVELWHRRFVDSSPGLPKGGSLPSYEAGVGENRVVAA